MDPVTPVENGLRLIKHLNGPYRQWVSVDRASHKVLFNSKYDSDPTNTCGWDLFEQFIKNPYLKVNSECKNKTEFFHFEGNKDLAMMLFGTTDYYENPETKEEYSESSKGGIERLNENRYYRHSFLKYF